MLLGRRQIGRRRHISVRAGLSWHQCKAPGQNKRNSGDPPGRKLTWADMVAKAEPARVVQVAVFDVAEHGASEEGFGPRGRLGAGKGKSLVLAADVSTGGRASWSETSQVLSRYKRADG